MSMEDYKKAYKLGRKDYQNRLLHGKKPTLEVLDSILPPVSSLSYESLGLVQIPIDQIVGTRYDGRSSAFAGNFMPILNDDSEFAVKWANLSTAHEMEGIHDAIKAVEYMNRFYVEEGNKRVSVMKYFQADSILGTVTRIIPKRTEETENKIYYEFLDFYKLSQINYIWFSKEGSFVQLQSAVGKAPEESWTDDDKMDFNSVYTRFTSAYEAAGGKKLSITSGDAFLALIRLYDYKELAEKTANEIKSLVNKSFQEFRLLQEEDEIELKMDPSETKKSLLEKILPGGKHRLHIGFVYAKTPTSSAWTYAHELGRMHIESQFAGEVTTAVYENADEQNIEQKLAQAVEDGCNMIFTTSPVFAQASVKAAIQNPEIRILNCSLNTSHKYIRTYYTRMHEAKFLMGAIAGSMAENDRLCYIADYPLAGTIAHINAFALGARMVNPRAKVFLEWSTKKGANIGENIDRIGPSCISGRDMVIPEEQSRYYGIYHMENGRPRNLAMPLCHWGKLYEKLIRTMMDGAWKQDDNTQKAINYWWGMSSDVVDVICSQNLPVGTKRLVELLRQTIRSGEFNLFSGELYSQNGMVQGEDAGCLTPEQIMGMDWLAENVIGSIPTLDELTDQAKPVTSQQGLKGLLK